MLVERSTRGVTLTDAGRALLATADAIHAELQLGAQRLRALAAGGPQALTVVTFPSAGEPLLVPALTPITAAAGEPVEITVIEAEPDEALGSVRDGRADLALLYHFHTTQRARAWPAAPGPGTYIPLVAEPLRLLVPAGQRLARPGRQPGRGRRPPLDPRVGRGRRCHRHARRPQRFPPPGRLPLQRLPLHERPGRRRCRLALVPSLALTGSPLVHDLPITPQPTRYIGAWLPRRHQPNPAAERLAAALRAHALRYTRDPDRTPLTSTPRRAQGTRADHDA